MLTNKQQEYVRLNKWLYELKNSGKLKNWLNVPQNFAGIKQWLKEDVDSKRRQSLGFDIAEIIETTAWYDEVSTVRNNLIHKGAHTLVFPQPEEGILFQVYGKGYEQLANNNFYIVENNIASFERYAVLYLSHLLIFLEHFAVPLRHKLSYIGDTSNAKFLSPGFDVLVQWIEMSLTHIKKYGFTPKGKR
jgi:hypothetical protein